MIPNGWHTINLLNLSDNGLMNGAFNNPKLVGTGYKLINVVNLYSGSHIKVKELKLLNSPESDYEKFNAKKGDVFFTRSSLKVEGIAHCNIFLEERDDVIFECHIIRIRPDINKVDPRYLHSYCSSPNARKHFMSCAKTTTMTTIDQNGIGSLTVLIPPLPEQYKIAEILGVWDESIDLLEKLISAKCKLKQGLMQQLLTGKKRFKEFVNNFSASTTDKLPDCWLNLPIGKICHSIVPGRNKPKQFDGDIPWVTTPNITQKYILKDNINLFVSEKEIKKCGGKIVPKGSVIINCVGDFGLIGIASQRVVINQQLHAFVCPEDLNNEYVFYALSIWNEQNSKAAIKSRFY